MAKPTGALLSFSASGTIAKTAVYASWRGRQYVRRHVVPHNPRSTGQTTTRNMFKTLMASYKTAQTGFATAWIAAAKGHPFTDRNLFNRDNIHNLRGQTSFAALTFAPGNGGGLAPNTVVATPGTGQLSIAVTAPTPPTGWTVTALFAAAVISAVPASGAGALIHVGTAASGAIVLTGLTSGTLYEVGGWVEWTKPNGQLAYGPSINTTGTPT